jgi:hypothetical protein
VLSHVAVEGSPRGSDRRLTIRDRRSRPAGALKQYSIRPNLENYVFVWNRAHICFAQRHSLRAVPTIN